jgi:hypothetical protein
MSRKKLGEIRCIIFMLTTVFCLCFSFVNEFCSRLDIAMTSNPTPLLLMKGATKVFFYHSRDLLFKLRWDAWLTLKGLN